MASSVSSNNKSAYRLVVGWGLLLLILYGIGRTAMGAIAIYYSLLIIIALLLLTHYESFKVLLAPTQEPLS
jgi:hypothetical protein